MSDGHYWSTQNKETCTKNQNDQTVEEEKTCYNTKKKKDSALDFDVDDSERLKDERNGYTPVQEPINTRKKRSLHSEDIRRHRGNNSLFRFRILTFLLVILKYIRKQNFLFICRQMYQFVL